MFISNEVQKISSLDCMCSVKPEAIGVTY